MGKLRRAVSAFLHEPGDNQRAVVRATVLSPTVARSVRNRGLARTRSWLANKPSPQLVSPVPDHILRYADHAIRALPLPISCLERSLVVWWLSREDLTIRFGVSSDQSSYRFHAWVERNGVVVNDRPEVTRHFLPLSIDLAESADPMRFGTKCPRLAGPMDKELKLRRSGLDSVAASEETVILDELSEQYLATNPAGSLLWEALENGATPAALADLLVDKYGIVRAQAIHDVDAFIDQLGELDLLDELPGSESAADPGP